MTPILIVHQDNIWDHLDLKIQDGFVYGTLDNFLGVIVTFKLLSFLTEYKVPVIYTSGEEVNFKDSKELAKSWYRKVLPIVIDVTNTSGCDCALENIYKLPKSEVKGLVDIIEAHEDFKVKTKKYNGDIQDADDSWPFIKQDIKVFSFSIPVEGNFHTKEARISIDKLERCTRCLKWLLSYYL